ncbi:MAG: helix-turn-helix transcriptional regulator [Deltaproteobacteria bacterium]|nr:helix-turn-helix transcriptional regulator [Deltaproteobacteria bacterium]
MLDKAYTYSIETEQGKVLVITDFKVATKIKHGLEQAIDNVFKNTKPVKEILDWIKNKIPEAGTPIGTIKAYMSSNGWTQKKLSQISKIPQSHISDIINKKRKIGVTIAKKFGKAFRVDYRKFL